MIRYWTWLNHQKKLHLIVILIVQPFTFLPNRNFKNVEIRPIVAGNMVQQPATKFFKFKKSNTLKNSEYIMKNSFGIGNHHEINKIQRKYVADTISKFINKKISK